MTCKELQEEELEVLRSIYDGDENFKEISLVCFQYKVCAENESKSFLLEISWEEKYPNTPPTVSLDVFYNKRLLPEVKSVIASKILEEANQQLGTPMTYTLFEFAKDNVEEFTKLQPETLSTSEASVENKVIEDTVISSSKTEKQPKLSKHQKKKLADRLDAHGERPRGWDWVDVVKHLSQIGPKQTWETDT